VKREHQQQTLNGEVHHNNSDEPIAFKMFCYQFTGIEIGKTGSVNNQEIEK
jgi:hypothetical protein